jgi:hypothetical protein
LARSHTSAALNSARLGISACVGTSGMGAEKVYQTPE